MLLAHSVVSSSILPALAHLSQEFHDLLFHTIHVSMMAAKTLSIRVSAFFLLTIILLTFHPYPTSAASSSTSPSSASVSPPAATPVPTIVQSTSSWKYYGCYSETTLTNGTGGVRALNGGSNQDSDTMIVESCLAFCSSGGYGFAGLEYTRFVTSLVL